MKTNTKLTFVSFEQGCNSLVNHFLSQGHAFVFFREPNTNEVYFLASSKPEQLSHPQLATEMRSGYLAAPFRENRKTSVFIPADIHFQCNLSDDKLSWLPLNPESSELDIKKTTEPSYSKLAKSFKQPDIIENQSYTELVKSAQNLIKDGLIEKVAVCRNKNIKLNFSPDLGNLYDKICTDYPAAMCVLYYHPDNGLWMGASPELLVSEINGIFKTVALAGTKPDTGESTSQIAWSQKEIEEQAMVSRYIIDQFKKIRLREFKESGPKTVRAGNVMHLKTEYTVNTAEVAVNNLTLTMLELLHPTSAVGGMPRAEALNFLLEYELLDRSLYTGYWGPVNISSKLAFYVNLRCVMLYEESALFFAGAGITAESDPESEFRETELKMNSLAAYFNTDDE